MVGKTSVCRWVYSAVREDDAKYRVENREKNNARDKDRYHADIEKSRASGRRRTAIYGALHPERIKAASRKYLSSDAGKLARRNSEAKRRSQKGDGPGLSKQEYDDMWASQVGLCKYCGKEMSDNGNSQSVDYCTMDHIIPLSKGGIHEKENIVLCCRSCNSKKKDKVI